MIQANVAAAETLEARSARRRLPRARCSPPGEAQRRCASSWRRLDLQAAARRATLKPGDVQQGAAAAPRTCPSPTSSTRWSCARRRRPIYAAENIGHFGLNLRRYAHFTSPIRRYADLLVHRALIRALGLGDGGLADEECRGSAAICQADLGCRAPGHGGRARDHRPADRGAPRRPRGRGVRGAHRRRHALRPVRAPERHRRRRLRAGRPPSATTTTTISRTATR